MWASAFKGITDEARLKKEMVAGSSSDENAETPKLSS